MNDDVRIVIRALIEHEDEPFIYSSWRNAACYGTARAAQQKVDSDFFKQKTVSIRNILKTATVRIACLEDDPMTIVGYSVTRDAHLEFIYVKIEFRGKGIATLLMPKDVRTVTPDLTKIGAIIAQKKGLVIGPIEN